MAKVASPALGSNDSCLPHIFFLLMIEPLSFEKDFHMALRNFFLELDRLCLRAVESKDAPLLAACNNDPDVRQTFFTHTPTNLLQQEKRIESLYTPGSDYIPFVIEAKETGTCVGITALHRVDLISGAAVFSICLCDTESWGQGYAREALNGMLSYAFDVLNLHRVQLHVWTGNDKAFKAYKAAGFKEEGLLREAMKHQGQYCDFHVMGILEEEWRKENSNE
jgi:RimJ/RimL family protein N-acetyltransferase